MNFLPFALVDPGPADGSARLGAGAGTRARPGDNGAAGEAAHLVTFPEVGDFDFRYVQGYGNVANVEAGMAFFGGSCWDPPLRKLPGHFGAALGCQDRW